MKKIYFILAILIVSNLATAQSNDQIFAAGNNFYNAAKYDSAIIEYSKILDQNKESSYLYYNLGNAYFKQNNIGKAILYYERAYRLNPSDDDIEHNLAMARTQVTDKFDDVPQFFMITFFEKIKSMFSANTWGTLALTLFAIVLVLALLFLFSKSLFIRRLSFWLACLALVLLICCKCVESSIRSVKGAIVSVPVVTAKSSPDDNGKDVFLLHEGTKIRVRDELGEWQKIELPNGEQGWVVKESIDVI